MLFILNYSAFRYPTGDDDQTGAMNAIGIAKTSIGLILVSASCLAPAQPVSRVGERPIKRAEVATFVGEQFGTADVDKDGTVTKPELQSFRTQLASRDQAMFDDMLAQSFDQADIDGDGEIARWEVDQRAMQFFDMVDVDRDGIASTDEQLAAQALTNLDASDFEGLLGQFRRGWER